MMAKQIAVILAAGKGTRMESDLPKVLVRTCGRPLIEYVLDAVTGAGVDHSLVVVGYQAERVRESFQARQHHFRGSGGATWDRTRRSRVSLQEYCTVTRGRYWW